MNLLLMHWCRNLPFRNHKEDPSLRKWCCGHCIEYKLQQGLKFLPSRITPRLVLLNWCYWLYRNIFFEKLAFGKCRVVCVLWHQLCKKSKEINSLWLHHVIQEHTDINLHCIIHQENDIAVLLSCTLKEKIIASLSTGGHKIIKASIKFKGRLEKSDIGKIHNIKRQTTFKRG